MSDKFLAERRRAKHVIENLFNALLESGSDLLSDEWRLVYEFYRDNDDEKRRTICDFVSGMTNRYCVEFYERLFGPRPPSIHKP
jgi:dGTPase